MKSQIAKILMVAVAAGVLGLAASLAIYGPGGPLLHTEVGQRVLQGAMSARAPEPPADLSIARRGDILPSMSLFDLEGRAVALPATYAGRPLLINVWASWCAPCIDEMPELQRFSSEQAANGVQVVGIALDDPHAVHDFLKRIPVTYPILIDTPGPRDAGVRLGNPKGVLPYSVLISAEGRLLKQRLGPFAEGEIADWATN